MVSRRRPSWRDLPDQWDDPTTAALAHFVQRLQREMEFNALKDGAPYRDGQHDGMRFARDAILRILTGEVRAGEMVIERDGQPPDRAQRMKEAASAAQANLDGWLDPMPPMVRYLDEDGELLQDQPMSDEMALEGYRVMLQGSAVRRALVSLQRQGRMVTLAPGIGQEAATVGAAMAMIQKTDWFVPQYQRARRTAVARLPAPTMAFLWHVGHPIAFQVPGDLKMLPFQAAIAGQLPQAVGSPGV